MQKQTWLYNRFLVTLNSDAMALIFMPKKSAFIILLVLGMICLVDGIAKKDIIEILVALVLLGYSIISLATGRKKRKSNENLREQKE